MATKSKSKRASSSSRGNSSESSGRSGGGSRSGSRSGSSGSGSETKSRKRSASASAGSGSGSTSRSGSGTGSGTGKTGGSRGRSASSSGGRSDGRSGQGKGRSSEDRIENLEDAFLCEVNDMLDGARELTDTLPKLAEAAQHPRLREALEMQVEMGEEQVERLERVVQALGEEAEPEPCEGMRGILQEAEELLEKTSPGPVRDAMIVAAAQKAGHYEIASYGTLCSWAYELREEEAIRLLERTLREKKAADRELTRIAEASPNVEAERGGGRYERESQNYGRFEEERERPAGRRETGMRSGGRPGRERGGYDE